MTNSPDASEANINRLAENYLNRDINNKSELQSSIQIDKMNEELLTSIKSSKDSQIDSKYDRYPYCIVWTPLPLIT